MQNYITPAQLKTVAELLKKHTDDSTSGSTEPEPIPNATIDSLLQSAGITS